jgi:hypothetical protein
MRLRRGRVVEDLLALSDAQDVRDVAEAYRTASSWLSPHVQVNSQTVARLSNWLSLSCVLLAIEVTLWTISLAG